MLAHIKKLVDIRDEGKLGELLERLSYARRELDDYDALADTHAQLDAENIGRAAAKLLGVDEGEATESALELITPCRARQLGIELIREFHAQLFGPQPQEKTTATPTKRAW